MRTDKRNVRLPEACPLYLSLRTMLASCGWSPMPVTELLMIIMFIMGVYSHDEVTHCPVPSIIEFLNYFVNVILDRYPRSLVFSVSRLPQVQIRLPVPSWYKPIRTRHLRYPYSTSVKQLPEYKERHTYLIAVRSFQLATMRSSGDAPPPNASAIRLMSPTTSIAKSNAFCLIASIFCEVTGIFISITDRIL
jgi:hypothetical protein